MASGGAGLSGRNILNQMKSSGVEFVISVPDITTAAGLLAPLEKETTPRLIRICKEDEGVGICAGLAHTNKRAVLLIQQTGLLDSINAIRGVAVEYSLPIVMMVGLLEKSRTFARGNRRATACGSSNRSLRPWASSTTRSNRMPMSARSVPRSTPPTRTPNLSFC